MIWLRRQWLPLLALVAAAAALIGSVAWVAGRGGGEWPIGMMGPATRGDGPVGSLADAQDSADRFGQRWGLRTSEVMQFDNGFYAELVDAAGNNATEVLIDPATGAVGLEPGPAMMWNTGYGMHPGDARDGATVSPEQARRIADTWLAGSRRGERADQAEAFPGYYTLHTLRDGEIVGMLSVHAITGEVWYHSWHGRFLGMREANP